MTQRQFWPDLPSSKNLAGDTSIQDFSQPGLPLGVSLTCPPFHTRLLIKCSLHLIVHHSWQAVSCIGASNTPVLLTIITKHYCAEKTLNTRFFLLHNNDNHRKHLSGITSGFFKSLYTHQFIQSLQQDAHFTDKGIEAQRSNVPKVSQVVAQIFKPRNLVIGVQDLTYHPGMIARYQ